MAEEDGRKLFAPIALPNSHNSYIPNERLKNLRHGILNSSFDEKQLADIDYNLQINMKSLKSWCGLKKCGGSETYLLDNHANKTILEEIVKVEEGLSLSNDAIGFTTELCSSVKSEYRVEGINENNSEKFILVGSECKGVEHSEAIGVVQGTEIAGDACLNLFKNTKIRSEECSTPGILVYGDRVRVYGVYLFKGQHPCVVFLTPALCYTDVVDRAMIARAIMALSKYACETLELCKSNSGMREMDVPLDFELKTCFLKPIRCRNKLVESNVTTSIGTLSLNTVSSPSSEMKQANMNALSSNGRINLERIMYIYNQLDGVLDMHEYVLFPVGMLCIPGEEKYKEGLFGSIASAIEKHFPKFGSLFSYCPVLVFPLLDSSWNNVKPTDQKLARAYIEAVTTGIGLLNEAKVSHMDLRPSNIMWKWNDEKNIVDIQFIDFEDAIMFGNRIRMYDLLVGHEIYPTQYGKYADTRHNLHFLENLKGILRKLL